MSEEEKPSVEQLGGLLDEALSGFGKAKPEPVRSTDDDLDDFLAPMDAEATKKAAETFEKLLKDMSEKTEQIRKEDEPTPTTASDGTHFLSELLGINKLLDEDGADPEIRQLTEVLLQGCFTKEVIHPLLGQFHGAIVEYLSETELAEGEKANLEAQKEVFQALIISYENQSDPVTSEETEQQNALWAKLRDLGEVPPALIEKFEKNMPNLGIPGLPGMSEFSADQQCSIM
ncbi:unnamed protein product [Bursaphelenchus xylophilus]|uniref:Peroxin-19 n=1 Tax=Bursaphelenchus xylophilus TaxID=6326 RepID=A0A1I7RIE1_BURXY|nr:unnamed protein product [Bursaphelenchus xylophilus]CAG9080881.1 unnamed protein product [Bursaphelenchus xylophilus]